MTGRSTLALRLAGPLQSWGTSGEFNKRDTDLLPSKSGVIGLLAAAQGRPRGDDITDLIGLQLGVRVDAAGSILRDYHTVSDYRGQPLLSSAVLGSGAQKRTSPKKGTHITERYYLQDATFVAAVEGPTSLITTLAGAVRHPVFPLALGRRACVPVQPLIIRDGNSDVWDAAMRDVLGSVPWQVSSAQAKGLVPFRRRSSVTSLAVTLEVREKSLETVAAVVADVPTSFAPKERAFRTRTVVHDWITVPTPFGDRDLPGEQQREHDPFELLGWN